MRNLVTYKSVYTGRIGGESVAPISLKPQSEDAMEVHVLLKNPVLDSSVRTEVSLNAELIRLGIARAASPRQSHVSSSSSTKNPVEELR